MMSKGKFDLKKDVLDWLQGEMELREYEDGYALVVPFSDLHGAYTAINIWKTEKGLLLDDDGVTFGELWHKGFPLHLPPEERKRFKRFLSHDDCKLTDGVVQMPLAFRGDSMSTLSGRYSGELPYLVFEFLRILTATGTYGELWLEERRAIKNKDVQLSSMDALHSGLFFLQLLQKNGVKYDTAVDVVGECGLCFRFPFRYRDPKTKKQVYVLLYDELTSIERDNVLLTWLATKSKREADSSFLVVFDKKETLPKLVKTLKAVGILVVFRNELRELFPKSSDKQVVS